MRGIPQFNFPNFFVAANELRAKGNEVFSPAERDVKEHGDKVYKDNPTGDLKQTVEETGFDLRKTFSKDLEYICQEADAIALLPGWEDSRGATVEKAVAEFLGLPVIFLPGNKPVRIN